MNSFEQIDSTIYNFVVNGTYCESGTLDRVLDTSVRSFFLRHLFVAAWNPTRLYTTLLRCLDEQGRHVGQEDLIAQSVTLSDLLALEAGTSDPNVDSILPKVCTALKLNEVDREHERVLSIVKVPTFGVSAASVLLMLRCPLDQDEGPIQLFANRLHTLINTHPAVVISKSADDRQRIDARVAAWLSPELATETKEPSGAADHMNQRAFAAALIREACSLTKSQVARLFVPARTVNGLRLFAQYCQIDCADFRDLANRC